MFFPIRDYNPTYRVSIITILLVIVNIIVFAFQSYFSEQPFEYHVASAALVPYEISHMENVSITIGEDSYGRKYYVQRDISPLLTFITSMFMHGSLLHLLGNIWFLWIFGNDMEDHLGRTRFLIFYLLCGFAASISHIVFNMDSTQPMLGASGAISGIMGAYLILYPHARIRTLVFVFIFITFMNVPAFIFLIIWFAFQFLYAGAQSGIAWLAHVGGFIAGLILIKLIQRRPGPRKPIIELVQ